MKKIIKVLFVFAILYLTFYMGLRLAGNQGLMVDRFAMNPNEFSWIDKTGVWIVILVPFVTGIIGLIFIGIQLSYPNRSYAFYEKCFACLFVFSTILCVVIAGKVYSHQKPYARVIQSIGSKISLHELEAAGNKSGEQLLYITRTGSIECAEVTGELYHVLLDTGVGLRHYDTYSDSADRLEQVNKILDTYGVTQVPALLIFEDGNIAEHFEGSEIIDGIISYAGNQS